MSAVASAGNDWPTREDKGVVVELLGIEFNRGEGAIRRDERPALGGKRVIAGQHPTVQRDAQPREQRPLAGWIGDVGR